MPRNSCMVVSPVSNICCGKKFTTRIRTSLFQITLYVFWGWFYVYRAVECLWMHQRHILSNLNTNPKCVIHVSRNDDPCVCRVKSYSFVAMMLFQRCLTFPLHLNCPSISCSPFRDHKTSSLKFTYSREVVKRVCQGHARKRHCTSKEVFIHQKKNYPIQTWRLVLTATFIFAHPHNRGLHLTCQLNICK